MTQKNRSDGFTLHSIEGFKDLKVQPGDVVVLSGSIAVGKTKVSINIVDHFLRADKRVLYVTYQEPCYVAVSRLLALRSDKSRLQFMEDVKHNTISKEELAEAYSKLDKLLACKHRTTLQEIIQVVEQKTKEGASVDLLVIDYDYAIPSYHKSDLTESFTKDSSSKLDPSAQFYDAVLNETFSQMKRAARDFNLVVLMVSFEYIEDRAPFKLLPAQTEHASLVVSLDIPKRFTEDPSDYKQRTTRPLQVVIDKYSHGVTPEPFEVMMNFETGKLLSDKVVK